MTTATIPVSVHMLTFNSAATIEKALTSVAGWCEDILVADGGSTDETVTITKRYGARVILQREDGEQGGPITDFSAVRNRVLRENRLPWVLVLDSDEMISEELRREMDAAVREGTPGAFLIPRIYVLPDGRRVDHASTYPNARLYFFHRDCVEHWIKPVHERPLLTPGTRVRTFTGASLSPLSSLEEFKRRCREIYFPLEQRAGRGRGWMHWLRHRVWHTLRSRLILGVKLLWIWLTPRRGVRMPLRYELARYWYGWQLIKITCPLSRDL